MQEILKIQEISLKCKSKNKQLAKRPENKQSTSLKKAVKLKKRQAQIRGKTAGWRHCGIWQSIAIDYERANCKISHYRGVCQRNRFTCRPCFTRQTSGAFFSSHSDRQNVAIDAIQSPSCVLWVALCRCSSVILTTDHASDAPPCLIKSIRAVSRSAQNAELRCTHLRIALMTETRQFSCILYEVWVAVKRLKNIFLVHIRSLKKLKIFLLPLSPLTCSWQ